MPESAWASGKPGHTADTAVSFGRVAAKFVKLTMDKNRHVVPQTGLRTCMKSGPGILPVGLGGIGILPMIHGLEAHATRRCNQAMASQHTRPTWCKDKGWRYRMLPALS